MGAEASSPSQTAPGTRSWTLHPAPLLHWCQAGGHLRMGARASPPRLLEILVRQAAQHTHVARLGLPTPLVLALFPIQRSPVWEATWKPLQRLARELWGLQLSTATRFRVASLFYTTLAATCAGERRLEASCSRPPRSHAS